MVRAYDDYGNIVEDYEEQIRAELLEELIEWLKENPKYKIKVPAEFEMVKDLIPYHHNLIVKHLEQLKEQK